MGGRGNGFGSGLVAVGEPGTAGGFGLAGRMGRGDGVAMDAAADMARGVGSGRGEVFTMTVRGACQTFASQWEV